MTLPTLDQVMQWPGLPVQDADGTAVGTCRSVYADDDTRIPEWVEVAMPEDGIAFVPTLGASESGGTLRLAQPAAKIAGSPRFAPDAHLEPADEKALYDHYGVAYSREHSDTLLPAAADGDVGDAPAPTPVAPRKLHRIEPVSPAATTIPPPAPRPVVTPAPASSQTKATSKVKAKPLALAAAVPVAVLAARRSGVLSLLGRRKQQQRRRATGAGALALLAPLAAGAAAKVAQRRAKSARSSDSETVIALPPAPVTVPVTAPVTVVETTAGTDLPPTGPLGTDIPRSSSLGTDVPRTGPMGTDVPRTDPSATDERRTDPPSSAPY